MRNAGKEPYLQYKYELLEIKNNLAQWFIIQLFQINYITQVFSLYCNAKGGFWRVSNLSISQLFSGTQTNKQLTRSKTPFCSQISGRFLWVLSDTGALTHSEL